METHAIFRSAFSWKLRLHLDVHAHFFFVFFSHTHSIFAALFFWVISVLSRSLEFYFIPVALSLHFLLINFKLNIIIIIIVHIRLLMRHNSIVIRWYLWVQVIIIFHLQFSFSFFLFPPYLPLIHAHSASLFASDSLYSFIALLHFGFFSCVFSLSLSSCFCFCFLCSVWFFICLTHSKCLSFEVLCRCASVSDLILLWFISICDFFITPTENCWLFQQTGSSTCTHIRGAKQQQYYRIGSLFGTAHAPKTKWAKHII